MRNVRIDTDYMKKVLRELLDIPSPTGFTDEVVRYTCERLTELGVRNEITRRGAIRADLKGKIGSPDRAIVAHLDTIGAMVRQLKPDGRLGVVPIGTWSSRFAEGARVTVYSDVGHRRGTLLPTKASGHAYNLEVDTQPVSWDNIELRVDEPVYSDSDLRELGIDVGDLIAVDPQPEFSANGYINSRHLDDKAGVAVLLAVAKAVMDKDLELPVDCHLLFTISEEVGSGASSVLHGDVAEMVTIDTGPVAPGQASEEHGVTICMQDSAGPFDYHLTRKLAGICKQYDIRHRRDVFLYYRCDSASAVESGNDIRTALVCFGTDATHGYERCHEESLKALGSLLILYLQTEPMFLRDRDELGPIAGFPELPLD